MHLFHYHLVTRRLREVEARYLGKLGFELVARYGRMGDDLVAFEAGYSWEDLDGRGFKLRLSELERGAVNVVVQPGQWDLPRVDHLGLALDEDGFVAARDWIDELLRSEGVFRLAELQLRADDPAAKASALADMLALPANDGRVEVGETIVRFLPGGPQGRPELHAELFV
jgi:hypothetical protein